MTGAVPPARQCTAWGNYSTESLWKMVEGEDDADGWRQVAAWGRMEQAVGAQRRRLVACRQALVEKWPPQTSEASRVFVAHLDGLIASMDQTLKAASSTSAALAGIMQALATAKREMDPLRQEYAEKSNDLVLRSWDGAEDEINDRARAVMAKAERAVMQYTAAIVAPPQYQFGAGYDGGTPFGPPGSPGSPGGLSGRPPGAGADAIIPPVPHHPPSPSSGDPPGSSGPTAGLPTGPILGGVTPPGVGGPGVSELPGGTAGGPSGPGGTGAPGAGGPGPGGPGGFGAGAVPTGGMIGAGGPGRGGGTGRGGRGAAASMGAPGAQPRSGSGGGRSAGGMPPGGVIGGAPLTGHAGHGGGRRSGDARHGDPDNPWEVAEGVPPIIEAPSEPRRPDPGPGVIGMGR